jgi:serine/threonine-protein kinase HipA
VIDLDVFLEGTDDPVGELSKLDTGSIQFHYVQEDLPHPISQSMPLREEPYEDVATRAFFDNLLFENVQRDQVMQRHGLEFGDTVGLLAHLGKDCPGAISVVPKGDGPAKVPGHLDTDYDAIGNLQEIMTSLRDTRRLPPKTNDPSPLAGVQGKIALTELANGQFALPKPGLNVPTTHILKVPGLHDMRQVEHEHLLLGIMGKVQTHPVAETRIIGDGDLQGLLITRFDRAVEERRIRRIHQEDFCQALGLGPGLKYQRYGEGDRAFSANRIGQSIRQLDNPAGGRQAFLEGTLINLLLGNTDNHAKNHALLYHGARPQLAPFYDIVPTILDDTVLHQLSFDIGAATMTDDIKPEDLASFVEDLGFRRMIPALKKRLQAITEHIVAHIPEMRGPARKRIGDAIAEQARWVSAALEMDIAIPERDLIVIVRP